MKIKFEVKGGRSMGMREEADAQCDGQGSLPAL